jgi:polyferredoxin
MVFIVWLRLRYFSCFAIDQHASALESLALSYVATKGLWFKILQYLLLYVLLFMGLAVFRGMTVLLPENTFGLIISSLIALIYFCAFLMVTAAIYASDVHVYTLLKKEQKAPTL